MRSAPKVDFDHNNCSINKRVWRQCINTNNHLNQRVCQQLDCIYFMVKFRQWSTTRLLLLALSVLIRRSAVTWITSLEFEFHTVGCRRLSWLSTAPARSHNSHQLYLDLIKVNSSTLISWLSTALARPHDCQTQQLYLDLVTVNSSRTISSQPTALSRSPDRQQFYLDLMTVNSSTSTSWPSTTWPRSHDCQQLLLDLITTNSFNSISWLSTALPRPRDRQKL